MKSKNLHLAVSTVIIVPIAFTYGLLPSGFFNNTFHFKFESTDLSSIFRALMGLYCAIAIFWIVGVLKSNYWIAATLSNVLFMSGLAVGRLVSIIIDGVPSPIFLGGFIAEMLLAAWGIFNVFRYKDSQSIAQ